MKFVLILVFAPRVFLALEFFGFRYFTQINTFECQFHHSATVQE